VAGTTDEFAFIEKLLAPVGAREIVYSCGVGDSDPAELPEALLRLRTDPARDRIEILFHDFLPLSPSYCLLDSDGVFRGLPGPERDDRAHQIPRADGEIVDLSGWRAAWWELAEAAESLTVFSEDSRDYVAQAFPGAASKIRIRPHALLAEVPAIPAPGPEAPAVIGVLGNIGVQKGAQVVQDMARKIAASDSAGARGQYPGLVLVGNIDPAYGLPATTRVHGTYRIAELDQLATKYGITCWLIPSVWPETFSYTTHEALATGLPVYAFHLGAQGATVSQAANGRPLNFDPEADLAEIVLQTVASDHAAGPGTETGTGKDPLNGRTATPA
jgi:glycosyltransferase involved in cell wall biosynthesis